MGVLPGFRVKNRERRVHSASGKLLEGRRIGHGFSVNIGEFDSSRFQGQLSNQGRPTTLHSQVDLQATQMCKLTSPSPTALLARTNGRRSIPALRWREAPLKGGSGPRRPTRDRYDTSAVAAPISIAPRCNSARTAIEPPLCNATSSTETFGNREIISPSCGAEFEWASRTSVAAGLGGELFSASNASHEKQQNHSCRASPFNHGLMSAD